MLKRMVLVLAGIFAVNNLFSEVSFTPLKDEEIAAIVKNAPAPGRLPAGLKLELLDFIDCTNPAEKHPFASDGFSKITEGVMGKYRETSVADNSFFSYRFKTGAKNEPLLVAVEYPDDKKRITAIFLHEEWVNGDFNSDFHIEEGYYTGAEYPNTKKYNYQNIFFWPQSSWPAVVCLNEEHGTPAAISKIWVYKIKEMPAVKVNEPEKGKRQIGIFFEDSRIFKFNFGGVDAGIKNIMPYLKFTGQNLLSYDCVIYAWAKSMVKAFEGNPGGEETDKVLAACDKNNIDFLAVFDPTEGFKVNGLATGDLTDDKVIEGWIEALEQFVDTYGKHPSLKGISFGGPAGCNRMKSPKFGKLQNGLYEMLRKKRPDIKLYVFFGYHFLHQPLFNQPGHLPYKDIVEKWEKDKQAAFSDILSENVAGYYKDINLNIEDYKNKEGLVVVKSYYPNDQRCFKIYPSRTAHYPIFRDFNFSQKIADLTQNGSNNGACLFGAYFEMTAPLFAGKNFWWDRTWIGPQINPAETYFKECYTVPLEQDDSPFMLNASWIDPANGSADLVKEFAAAYRTLPADRFATVKKENNVTVRTLILNDKTYFYVLNNHWAGAEVSLGTGGAGEVTNLTDNTALKAEKGAVKIILKPYDLQTYIIAGKVNLIDIVITRQKNSYEFLGEKIEEFGKKIEKLAAAGIKISSKYTDVYKESKALFDRGDFAAAGAALGNTLSHELTLLLDLNVDKPKFSCKKTDTKITVDGDILEWEGFNSLNIDSPENLACDHWLYNGWTGKKDLSAKFFLAHDGKNLYIAFNVLDDRLMKLDSLDIQFSKEYKTLSQDAKYSRVINYKIPYDRETVEGKGYVIKKTPEGYRGEIAIPLSDIGLQPGESIGMRLSLTDMDMDKKKFDKVALSSGSWGWRREKRMEWPVNLYWTGWKDPQSCGELVLEK